MTRKEMLRVFLGEFVPAMLAKLVNRNEGYASHDDPFRNLRRGGVRGVVIRLGDKNERQHNLTEPGAPRMFDANGEDKLEDTFIDSANYNALAWMMYTSPCTTPETELLPWILAWMKDVFDCEIVVRPKSSLSAKPEDRPLVTDGLDDEQIKARKRAREQAERLAQEPIAQDAKDRMVADYLEKTVSAYREAVDHREGSEPSK